MMGLTAEMLARHGISREMQDQFAARSHARAWAVTVRAAFQTEIVEQASHDADGVLESLVLAVGEIRGNHQWKRWRR